MRSHQRGLPALIARSAADQTMKGLCERTNSEQHACKCETDGFHSGKIAIREIRSGTGGAVARPPPVLPRPADARTCRIDVAGELARG